MPDDKQLITDKPDEPIEIDVSGLIKLINSLHNEPVIVKITPFYVSESR